MTEIADFKLFITSILRPIINEAIDERIKPFLPKNDPYNHLPELLTRKQVCEIFSITFMTLDAWVRQGRLNKYRANNMIRFKKSEVLKSLDSCQKYQRES
jgi:hypothetical protein